MKGKTEAELYHGESNYSKIYPRDVSRSYEGGKVNFVVYPKPSMLYYSSNTSSLESKVNHEEIEPLVIRDLVIRAKKKEWFFPITWFLSYIIIFILIIFIFCLSYSPSFSFISNQKLHNDVNYFFPTYPKVFKFFNSKVRPSRFMNSRLELFSFQSKRVQTELISSTVFWHGFAHALTENLKRVSCEGLWLD